ncbi:MAG: phosphohydrolase [Pseudoflavonifractor sp.]
MTVITEKNWHCFLACIGDLLGTAEVQSMKGIHHHPGVSCYEHSVFVAYAAFRLARRWHLDYVSAARGGLLHDLYLYDPKDKTAHVGNQCFAHPKAALANAALLTTLTPKEQNMILAHMWPLAPKMPHYREAYVVNLADKLCATAEVFGYWRRSRMKQIVMA